MTSTRRPRRWLRRIAIAAVAVALICGLGGLWLREPLPDGETGQAADALAHRIEAAVDREAWERTGAVRWTFSGVHEHLWDRRRGLCRVRWDDQEVLLRIDEGTGRAWRGGSELQGAERDGLLHDAQGYFFNDSFWLNPLVKLFDPGVTRRLVRLDDGGEGLLVTYSSGGRTPGDSYLWVADESGLPVYWRMWVSVIPIGGLKTSWEGWTTLSTGARIATAHGVGPFRMEMITEVEGAGTLAELEDPDPFAVLF